jgi:hypothetical protein
MTNDVPKPDPIGAAVAATEQQVQMEQMQVTISSTGRPFIVAFPTDMTDAELLEVIGWAGTTLRGHLAANRAKTAGGRIQIVGRLPT